MINVYMQLRDNPSIADDYLSSEFAKSMDFFTIQVTPVVVSGQNPNSVVVLLYEISYCFEPCYIDIV